MQEVYIDGSLGETKGFDVGALRKSLEDLNVDHVRVFNQETGGQIQVEINDLKSMIVEAVEVALKKHEIMRQYQQLPEDSDG